MSRSTPLALVLVGALTSATLAAGDASELEKAQEAFAAGRHLEALARARRAADAAPSSLPALLGRAGMAEFMGEFDEAVAFYAKATTLAPDDPNLLYRTASFAVRVGEYDRALANLDRVLELPPRHARWLSAWGPGPPARFIESRVAELRARTGESLRESAVVSLLSTHRDLSDDELDLYIAFESSDAGRAYNQRLRQALVRALERVFVETAAAMFRAVPPERWAQAPRPAPSEGGLRGREAPEVAAARRPPRRRGVSGFREA